MPRQISKNNGGKAQGPTPPKAQERELQKVLDLMINEITRYLKTNTVEKLPKATVEQFSDANYASTYLALNRKAQKHLLKRFSSKRLGAAARKILDKVNKRNAKQIYDRVADAVGVSADELYNSEGLSDTIEAMILETTVWIEKLRDETLQAYTANTLRVMKEGGTLTDVLAEFDGLEEKRKNQAKSTARTQVANFNSLLGKARAENLGIKKAVWVTSNDERVRGKPGGKYPNAKPSHWKANGKEFDLNKGLKIDGEYLLPGVDYNCRCTYEFIIPED